MKIYCETYGCTSNKVDAEILRGLIVECGHELTDDILQADVVVVNTCAVKGTTYKRMLKRLSELKKSDKRIIVAGCLPLIDLQAIKHVGEFDGIIGCKSLSKFPEMLERIGRGERNLTFVEPVADSKPIMCKRRYSSVCAAIPIAEGCVSACSYCSVRFARGKLRSFDPEHIVNEAKQLVRSGYREIQLTAQDTAAYGLDIGMRLPELILHVAEIPGDFRIRVGMMNPQNVLSMVDELIDAFRHERVYKFLHLPVQSGSDRILHTMRRNYSVDEFIHIVQEFQKKIQNLFLCTDVIVGFPGESEEDFVQTKELIRLIAPDKTNISKFYPMPGTEAAHMPQLNGRVVAHRSRELSALCREIGRQKNECYVGKKMTGFVIEPGEKGGFILRSENYKQVIVEQAEVGEFLRVKITEAFPTYLRGEPLHNNFFEKSKNLDGGRLRRCAEPGPR